MELVPAAKTMAGNFGSASARRYAMMIGLAESGSRRQHLAGITLAWADMTSISSTAAVAKTHAAPKAATRNLALDRTRTFLTLVVVVHHAVIPYTYFGHTDPKSWIGFDAVVTATDSFFMAMFFFLSGLFVWPGLKHKAPTVFLR